jgi:hypothetical protein
MTVAGGLLRNGNTKSCGCLKREVTIARNTTHGLSNTPTFDSWRSMVHRTTNPRSPQYPNYGGRGITIDPRWLNFDNFLADMGTRPPGTSIDRRDNNGPYAAWNCKWSTPHEQMRNTRSFKLTPDVVAEVKRLRATGLTLRKISTQTNLGYGTVWHALSGKSRSRHQ